MDKQEHETKTTQNGAETKAIELHAVTILIGDGQQQWGFLFKSEEAAHKHLIEMNSAEPILEIHDDFGQSAHILTSRISAIMVTNLLQGSEADIERSLHHARVQKKANRIAEAEMLIPRQSMQSPFQQLGPQFRS